MTITARITGIFNPRGAHRSPPLRIVRAERDKAVLEAQQYATRASRAEDRVRSLKAENARLKARVAFLENSLSVRIPAPMDNETTIPIPVSVSRATTPVVPLHLAPVGA